MFTVQGIKKSITKICEKEENNSVFVFGVEEKSLLAVFPDVLIVWKGKRFIKRTIMK